MGNAIQVTLFHVSLQAGLLLQQLKDHNTNNVVGITSRSYKVYNVIFLYNFMGCDTDTFHPMIGHTSTFSG